MRSMWWLPSSSFSNSAGTCADSGGVSSRHSPRRPGGRSHQLVPGHVGRCGEARHLVANRGIDAGSGLLPLLLRLALGLLVRGRDLDARAGLERLHLGLGRDASEEGAIARPANAVVEGMKVGRCLDEAHVGLVPGVELDRRRHPLLPRPEWLALGRGVVRRERVQQLQNDVAEEVLKLAPRPLHAVLQRDGPVRAQRPLHPLQRLRGRAGLLLQQGRKVLARPQVRVGVLRRLLEGAFEPVPRPLRGRQGG